MDIRQHAEWQEVLDELKELASDLRQPSRRKAYRLYRWMKNSYIIEDIATEETILMRTELKAALNAARDHAIDVRDIVIDL